MTASAKPWLRKSWMKLTKTRARLTSPKSPGEMTRARTRKTRKAMPSPPPYSTSVQRTPRAALAFSAMRRKSPRSGGSADRVTWRKRGGGGIPSALDRLQAAPQLADDLAVAPRRVEVASLLRILGEVVELRLDAGVEHAVDVFPLVADERAQQRHAQLRRVAALEDEIGDDLLVERAPRRRRRLAAQQRREADAVDLVLERGAEIVEQGRQHVDGARRDVDPPPGGKARRHDHQRRAGQEAIDVVVVMEQRVVSQDLLPAAVEARCVEGVAHPPQ